MSAPSAEAQETLALLDALDGQGFTDAHLRRLHHHGPYATIEGYRQDLRGADPDVFAPADLGEPDRRLLRRLRVVAQQLGSESLISPNSMREAIEAAVAAEPVTVNILVSHLYFAKKRSVALELAKRADVPDLIPQDSWQKVIEWLEKEYGSGAAGEAGNAFEVWHSAGLTYRNVGRVAEALGVFERLYAQALVLQKTRGERLHKGTPLVWIADCLTALGRRCTAKRYLMYTLCEDAISYQGLILAEKTGVYHRLLLGHGLADAEIRRYARDLYSLYQEAASTGHFPELLVHDPRIDDEWMTEVPSPEESTTYLVTPLLIRHLLENLGDKSGHVLERLAHYLMAAMPGCRVKRRVISRSTDYDLVCSAEGPTSDFRSELGRYFLCECKDWETPADVTVMAKMCRILDSTKCRFGVIFSKNGITGADKRVFAENEQFRVFMDRGIVIVALNESDIARVERGANLISLLRSKYETLRLDLRPRSEPSDT